MSFKIFFPLVLALLAVIVFADEELIGNGSNADDYTTGHLTVDQLCETVGFNTGCSGCELGTKKMCRWIKVHKEDFPEESSVTFMCVPKKVATEMIDEGNAWDASEHCPANPLKEPIIRDNVVGFAAVPTQISSYSYALEDAPADVVYRKISTANSSWIYPNHAVTPTSPWPVDRTSAYGSLGVLTLRGISPSIGMLDCAFLNDIDRADANQILSGTLKTEQDKFCARKILAQYLSTRCPAYGVAVSGLCKSAALELEKTCTGANVASTGSSIQWGLDGDSIRGWDDSIFPYYIVPDDTPYCLKSYPIWPNGRFEHLAGTDRTIEELADPETEVVYFY